ncbi:MAG: hypothetical protein IJZ96_00705 [Lachnospiraceae bacterium]|nr:hypothetical protein [Lachnospiraceae bacterium]
MSREFVISSRLILEKIIECEKSHDLFVKTLSIVNPCFSYESVFESEKQKIEFLLYSALDLLNENYREFVYEMLENLNE